MRIAFFAIGFLLLFSCTSNESCRECAIEAEKDTLTAQKAAESLESALAKEINTGPTKEQRENHEKIVQKYGEQWDFCTCIVANDSITDAFEGNLTPAQEEKLMARWEYVDSKCKELTTAPSTTPEERARHEKRVLKCLKERGLKK